VNILGTYFKLDGIEEYLEQLKNIADEADKVLEGALSEAIKPMVDDMRSRVPVRDGELREGITTTKVFKDGNLQKVSAGVIWDEWPGAGVHHENPELYYSVFQEFGTEHHDPQPFIWPSYEKNKKKSLNIIGAFVKRWVE
jgi:HK97 gp10 family phage protein